MKKEAIAYLGTKKQFILWKRTRPKHMFDKLIKLENKFKGSLQQ